jgi:hypothetical protein
LNRTREGLHFQTLEELETALKRAGFARCEIIRDSEKSSNLLIVAAI